mmetsp:Transcript_93021/g.300618  ORF Transcript_93021/g.300618 Transcript_93021/m.300618 type:complete len:246 (+) Transcript_93021:112-849(+)
MDASSTASVSQAPARYGLVRLTLAVRAFPAAGFSESDAAAAAAAVAKAVLALVGPDGVVDARLLAYDAVLFSALRGASQVGGPALEETALEEPAPPEAGLPPLLTTEGDVTSSALVWPCRSSSCCVCSESVLSAFGGYLAGVVAGQPGFPSPVRSSRTSCPHQGWMPNSRDVGRTRWIAGTRFNLLTYQSQRCNPVLPPEARPILELSPALIRRQSGLTWTGTPAAAAVLQNHRRGERPAASPSP